ncbi:MAG: carbohydrate ABC transporter permease [Actinobacteria bacterium]|nr:carbohydrate ABC transporter permease [Actinomycetota bacterium]
MKNSADYYLASNAEKKARNIFSILLAFYCSIVVFLMFTTFLSSFKTKSDLVNNTVGFPKTFTLDNYKTLIIEDQFLRNFLNSLVLTIMSIIAVIAVSSLTSYGLSRYTFKYSDALKSYFLLGLMFPIQLGILPIFIMLRSINLVNNLFGMVLLYAANMSFSVFIFSMFFKTLPNSLYEAAKVDGAGEFAIFYKIMLPLAKPVMATIALLSTITILRPTFYCLTEPFVIPEITCSEKKIKIIIIGIRESDATAKIKCQFARKLLIYL